MNFIQNETEQKLRGGYYTPLDLATYIIRWVLEKEPKRVLEPSCGDGVFIQALGRTGYSSSTLFTGFEIVEEEAIKARTCAARMPHVQAEIYVGDFLEWAIKQMAIGTPKFDAVVGNPPFIRYQYLPEDAQGKAEKIFSLLGLPFTKHTNAWVPFVLSSVALLEPGGRLGMIIPAEIIHVVHAQSLRTYLGKVCRRLLIIDPTEIWFDGTLQGAVILFAEKKDESNETGDGLGIVKVSGREFLNNNPSHLFDNTGRMNGRTIEGKWTRALLAPDERQLLDDLSEWPNIRRFRDIAKVDVGIVTGANKFFLVPDSIVDEFQLDEWAHPMFGRSNHVSGLVYSSEDHQANKSSGLSANFLWFRETDLSKVPENVKKYLAIGLSDNLHTRYKCRTRKCWYEVPSVYKSPIAMLKRAHNYPRLVLNLAEAYTTDTAYRIEVTGVEAEALVFGFVNSLTCLTAEIEGRHYGGGVLELVPSEIERLLVPVIKADMDSLIATDQVFRETDSEVDFLAKRDPIVLGKIGLSAVDQKRIHGAWTKLRNRRHRIAEQPT